MKVNFVYSEDKDIECLLTKGGGSVNSPNKPTKVYATLLAQVSDLNDKQKVTEFVRSVVPKNLSENIIKMQANWDEICDEFEKRAEKVFGLKISDAITAYLTITGRHPYSVEEKNFFVPADKINVNATCMHELWHFYTWHKFGHQQDVIGPAKYNERKEALTVLLNIECADFMAEEIDHGYSQHQDLRKQITEIWNETKNIEAVWF